MKILFLCGCLEPGRDGVGDYTRRLAAELVRQNHHANAIALYDIYLTEVWVGSPEVEEIRIPILRIPSNLSIQDGILLSKQWINEFNPDWISLQFVPFSFHPKGLPVWLSSTIKRLKATYNFHIMFHELWVGLYKDENIKKKFLGKIQKFMIKELIKKNKPLCITTSIPVYKIALTKSRVTLLPLFGNIPISTFSQDEKYVEEILRVVHFGSYTSHLEEFRNQLLFIQKTANFHNKRIEFLSFGEGGPYKNEALRLVENIFDKFCLNQLGHLPEQQISELFLKSNLGISNSDYKMHGKSGSTISMLEHGLPVILQGNAPSPDIDSPYHAKYNEQIMFCDSDFTKPLQRRPSESNLSSTSKLLTTLFDKH